MRAVYNVVDLVNRLEIETRNGRQGRIAEHLTRMDFIVLDELGYTFPPEFFKQGTRASCYNPPNMSISDGDKSIVAALYPTGREAKVKLQAEIKKNYLDLIKASGQAEGAKSGVAQLVGEYMP